MAKEQHTETYAKASRAAADVKQEAWKLEKQALALKTITDNLLSKADEETLVQKLKRKISGN